MARLHKRPCQSIHAWRGSTERRPTLSFRMQAIDGLVGQRQRGQLQPFHHPVAHVVLGATILPGAFGRQQDLLHDAQAGQRHRHRPTPGSGPAVDGVRARVARRPPLPGQSGAAGQSGCWDQASPLCPHRYWPGCTGRAEGEYRLRSWQVSVQGYGTALNKGGGRYVCGNRWPSDRDRWMCLRTPHAPPAMERERIASRRHTRRRRLASAYITRPNGFPHPATLFRWHPIMGTTARQTSSAAAAQTETSCNGRHCRTPPKRRIRLVFSAQPASASRLCGSPDLRCGAPTGRHSVPAATGLRTGTAGPG